MPPRGTLASLLFLSSCTTTPQTLPPDDDGSTGADLAGVDFAGADLTGVDFSTSPTPDLFIPGGISGILSADRVIDWRPGVEGGIPTPTLCADLRLPAQQAAYNVHPDDQLDDAPGLQRALDDCAKTASEKALKSVILPPGKHLLAKAILMRSFVTLRGSAPRGPGATVLEFTWQPGAYENGIDFRTSGYVWDFPGARALASGYTKGSTTLKTSAPHGWKAGDLLLVDDEEDDDLVDSDGNSGRCTWCGRPLPGGAYSGRPHSQMVEIRTVDAADAVTFSPPLYSNFGAAQKPQAVLVGGPLRFAGLEDLAVVNKNGAARHTIRIEAGYKSWIKNCDVGTSLRRHVWMYHSIWCEFRDSSWHHGSGPDWSGPAYGPDRAYGIFLGLGSTANLVENNDFKKLHFAIAFEGGVSGNVIAYNYVTDVMYHDKETPQPAIGNHGSHPMMNLWEGNRLDSKLLMDSYWGSSSHTTVYRNRITIQQYPETQQYAFLFDIWKQNRFHNIVGNLLGTVGVETEVDVADGPQYGKKAIYRLGFTDANDSSYAGNDPTVAATLIRHGNWDSVTKSAQWSPMIPQHDLPASLYLPGKPPFFANLPWPPFDPTTPTSMTNKLPAELR